MVRIWYNSATYGHGFLIPPIVGYLVWRRRVQLARLAPRPSVVGVLWLAGAAGVWLVGAAADTNLLKHFGFVLMVQGAAMAILGLTAARLLWFPLLYLLFMVPFGDFAIQPLQELTAHYTTALVSATGIPVYMENWLIIIPGGSFLVAEACAGVRFLIASVALGVLICDLMFVRRWKWALFIALSAAVPIVANVFRAYGIVMIAHLSDFELAVGVDHLVYGFIFLSFVMLLLIAIAFALRDPEADMDRGADAVPQAGRSDQADPAAGRWPWRQAAGVGAAALVLAVGVNAYAGYINRPSEAAALSLPAPSIGGDWELSVGAPEMWSGDFPAADAQQRWTFSNGATQLSLFIAYYREEHPGKELVSFENSIMPPDWKIIRSGAAPKSAEPLPPPRRHVVSRGLAQRTLWSWYWVGGQMHAKPAQAKLAALRAKLFGGERRAAFVALAAPPDEGGFAAVQDFVKHSALETYLSRVADQPD